MRSTLWRSDDRGASLVIALAFITVVAVGVTVTLSFIDTSLRASRAMRDQASYAANADGAAQVAINQIRKGQYDGTSGTCFTGGNSLTLSNLYQPQGGAADSAYVVCALDGPHTATDPNVAINSNNKPVNAILTLGTSGSEDGINVKVSGGRTLRVKGPIFSNSTINVPQGTLRTTSSATARGSCSGTITSTPAKQCNIGSVTNTAGNDPNYSPASGSTATQSVPSCKKNDLKHFSPGRYTDLTALNKWTSNACKDSILHFTPGTYYFDYNGEWDVDSGWIVGGTETSTLVAGTTPSIPGACVSPIPPDSGSWTRPGPGAGVQFIFGGTSRISLSNAQIELCGTYSTTSPPIAVYGLKSPVGPVSAQSGCVTTVGGCAVILTDNSPNSALYIQGHVYVPKAKVDISLNNATGQVLRYGIVARSLYLNPTGSADLDHEVIQIPDDVASFGHNTVVNLTVYVCPASSTCSASGQLRLRVKVGILDPSGSAASGGQRQVTVYNWSVQR
jgi:hypothetical protein